MIQPSSARLFAAAACVSIALPAAAEMTEVRLSTGEVLRGEVVEVTADTVRLSHPVMGEVAIPRAHLVRNDQDPMLAALQDEPTADPAAEEPAWKFKLTLAASATTGNSETMNFTGLFTASRETERLNTVFDAGYFYAESNNESSENKFTAGLRNDWLIPESDWFYFASGRYDYDDFQSWDQRVSGHVGVGYELIKPQPLELNLLAGIGAVKEWGSNNEDVRPEGLFGVEGAWQIAEKHSLTFSSTIYPDLDDVGEFRMLNTLAWSLLLDEQNGLSLSAGLRHEYQSVVDPDRDRNDLRLYAGLQLDF